MTKFDKTVVVALASVLSTCGVLIVGIRREIKIIDARLKRAETFKIECEAYNQKYKLEELNSPEAIAEFLEIVNRYENR